MVVGVLLWWCVCCCGGGCVYAGAGTATAPRARTHGGEYGGGIPPSVFFRFVHCFSVSICAYGLSKMAQWLACWARNRKVQNYGLFLGLRSAHLGLQSAHFWDYGVLILGMRSAHLGMRSAHFGDCGVLIFGIAERSFGIAGCSLGGVSGIAQHSKA